MCRSKQAPQLARLALKRRSVSDYPRSLAQPSVDNRNWPCEFLGPCMEGGPIVSFAVLRISPERNLSRYLQEIRKFPILSDQEERVLARLWRDDKDIDAAHRLVTSHLRLVAKLALGYRGYGFPLGELISEGSVGIMEAVKRFDPDRGFRLATYATWWIRAAMQDLSCGTSPS